MPSRKIYFYRIVDNGPKPDADFIWVPRPLLERVAKLEKAIGDAGKAYVSWEHDALLAIPQRNTPSRSEVVFGVSRRSSLPMADRKGVLDSLPLAPDQGLCETTHVLLLPKARVAVATFNFHGPRLSRLPWYLRRALGLEREPVRFDQLLMRDALERMERLQDLARLEVKITPSFAETFAKQTNDDVARQLADLGQYGETGFVTMKFQRKNRKGAPYLPHPLRAFARRLARRDDAQQNVDKLVVAGPGESGKMDVVDLLGDSLVATADFPDVGDDREHEVAFRLLREAFKEHRDTLDELPGASARRVKPRRS